MRHLVRGRKLGRTGSHRKATLSALSVALIKSERIVTTLAKAKALRSYVEPIITRAKQDSTHNRSHVFRHLRDNQATTRLFDEIGPMVEDRPGGYTRIIKLGVRPGDGAEKAVIELVDFNDAKPDSAGKKKRRTRRGGAGKSDVSKSLSAKSADAKPVAEKGKKESDKVAATEEESVQDESKEAKATDATDSSDVVESSDVKVTGGTSDEGNVKSDLGKDSDKEEELAKSSENKDKETAEPAKKAAEETPEEEKQKAEAKTAEEVPEEDKTKADKKEDKAEAAKSSESAEKTVKVKSEEAKESGEETSDTVKKDGDDTTDPKASKE